MTDLSTTSILGVKFAHLSMNDLLDICSKQINGRKGLRLAFANPEFLVEASKNEQLLSYLNECDYVLADGVGVLYAAAIVGEPLPMRVTGTDFVYGISALSAEFGHTMYFFGGRPGVAETAVEKLEKQFPGVKIVGYHHGYLNDDCEEETVELLRDIAEKKADFLMVCLGNPLQEAWIQKHKDDLPVSIIFGNGGALDFAAGIVRRAPLWMRKAGLEWLYRLGQDFSITRLRRQLRLVHFIALFIQQLFRKQVYK